MASKTLTLYSSLDRESEMNAPAFQYSVRLPFADRLASPDWLGSKFLATLDALTQIDSNIFPDWEVGDLPAMKGYPLAAARSRIAEIIGHNVGRDEVGDPEPESGYTAVAHTTIAARSHQMTVWAGQGDVWLNAGEVLVAPDPAIVKYSLFRAALLAINAIWQQPWACVQAFRLDYDKAPLYAGAAPFPYSLFHIPWIAYLGPSLLDGGVSSPNTKTENTPDGGLLMSAAEDRLDPTNPEHLRRARILAETLISQTGYQPGGTTRV
jgi:hypothetical protein